MRGTYRKLKDLPDEQRQQLRQELHQLRDLPPGEREQQRKELYKQYFSDEQQ